MGNNAFLLRGRTVPTVEMAPPSGEAGNGSAAAQPRSAVPQGISASVGVGSAVFSGRVSLGVLGGAILGMVGFYIWTRSAQGGG